jgi:hypothetical protein
MIIAAVRKFHLPFSSPVLLHLHYSTDGQSISFINATSALFDHALKEREDKKLREAEKVGGPKF